MAGSRVESMPVPTGTEVYIFAKKDWGTLIFLPVWLAFWTFGGLMAMKWVAHPGPNTPEHSFRYGWLVGCWGRFGLPIGGYGPPSERKL
jgi:hypothetical protein